jgi:hypothetical protein
VRGQRAGGGLTAFSLYPLGVGFPVEKAGLGDCDLSVVFAMSLSARAPLATRQQAEAIAPQFL